MRNCVNFSRDLFKSNCFKNSSKKNISFCLMILSGEIKEIQANFCPAIALSSSSKSIYLGFSEPSKLFLYST